MSRLPLRVVWPLFLLIAIPMTYNSCQSGLAGSGFKASKAASCKVGLENGRVNKMQLPGDRSPSMFSMQKVQLRDNTEAQAKAGVPLEVARGTELSVLLNNGCLQENGQELGETLISAAAVASGELLPELGRQAYQWKLDRAYTDIEIEKIAQEDACVVGISWNREYEIQATTFNDSGVVYQSHLNSLRAFDAYDHFYNAGGGMDYTGNPVKLAVIDTGVDWQHPDLQNNMWAHSLGIGIDITTLGTSLVDYNPFDVSSIGHGTHVAGLMAAVSNNSVGVVGAMPFRAKIMSIKLFKRETDGSLTTTSQHFYNAIRFARENGADVINLSLGSLTEGPATDSMAEAGIEEAVQSGIVVITVIGNADGGASGRLVDGVNFSSVPAQFATISGVLAVGSYDVSTGQKSSFSHYSPTLVEIGAPGAQQGLTGLYSLKPRALGSYGQLAGTSQAGPLVSAAAGLAIGIIRDAHGGIGPTPAEVETLLTTSAQKVAGLNPYFKDGNKLDLMGLVQRINSAYPNTRNGGSMDLPSYGCAR